MPNIELEQAHKGENEGIEPQSEGNGGPMLIDHNTIASLGNTNGLALQGEGGDAQASGLELELDGQLAEVRLLGGKRLVSQR